MSRLNYKQKNQEKTIFPVYFFPQLYLYGHSTTRPFLLVWNKLKNTSNRLVLDGNSYEEYAYSNDSGPLT
jgi:hypothetical protein